MTALFNGAPLDSAVSASRAWHYGDGVFRTILMSQGRPVDWLRQYTKLVEDAARLDLDAPDASVLEQELCADADSDGFGVAKIVLSRRPQARGYAPTSRSVDRMIVRDALSAAPVGYWQQGVRAMRSPVVLSSQPLLAGIKHLNRLEQVLATRDWPSTVQEALLVDARGNVVCGTRTNLFWVVDGRLRTPLLQESGVCGMMREKILEHARMLCLPCLESRCGWPELLAAEEIFLSNSLIGIWPVAELDAHRISAPGSVTRLLMQSLNHPWRGVQ